MFPSKNGILIDLIPAVIILGSSDTDYNKLRNPSGEYVQVYIGITDRTKHRTVGEIALHP